MSAAKLLILENSLGQKVRTFAVQSEAIHIVYLKDSRRIEAFSDLTALDDNSVSYTVIKNININKVSDDGLELEGLGRIRLSSAAIANSPVYTLPEEEDQKTLIATFKKSTAVHAAMVFLLLVTSWVYTNYFTKAPEQPLVTIVLPPKEVPPPVKEARQTVKMAQKKIKPTAQKVTKKTVAKKSTRTVKSPVKVAAKNAPTKVAPVRTAPSKDLRRVGALAALGGVANGSRNAEGLDVNSMKNIRAAGTGNGGGGIGTTGRGGAKGYLPGNGLIAGSAGEGARAQGAGGYGTRGSGGGKAGYGKIALVGGTSTATSLPLNEEVSVEGGLDQDQIIAVINRNKGQITYCYEQGLRAQPTIGGRVAVSFIIGPNGKISKANVAESSLGSRMVESCMLARMKTWQFPRPVGAVNVDVLYPFELTRVSAR